LPKGQASSPQAYFANEIMVIMFCGCYMCKKFISGKTSYPCDIATSSQSILSEQNINS
jgi:hypothetical protein